MSDHVHVIETPMPIDAALAAGLRDPLIIVVFDGQGNILLRGAPGIPNSLAAAALADYAAQLCAEFPPTEEEIKIAAGEL